MAKFDWYTNIEWNEEIEAAFYSKLARARNKSGYLRIQAFSLLPNRPEVSLRLLDEYFSKPDIDECCAHAHRAAAYLLLGRVEQALRSYEDALTAELRNPSMISPAALEYGLLVARLRLRDRYTQALNALLARQSLIFPREVFMWNAAAALMQEDQGRRESARSAAQIALEAAAKEHSGFRYHKSTGLVGTEFEEIKERLNQILNVPS